MAALNNRIRDKGLNRLIHRLLKCGYVNPLNLVDSRLEMEKGTPQGSIISPLMSNIFFHRLDKFMMEEIIPNYNKTCTPRKSVSEEYVMKTSI